MGKIQVGGSLQPGTVDTPLDARTRIATLDAVATIQVPYVGMTFYVIETGKLYIVKSLKAREVGSATVALAAVDQYEELVSGGDIDIAEFDNRYAQKDHDHAGAYAPLVAGVVPVENLPPSTAQRPKKLTLIKPVNAKAVWPVVEAFPDKTFTESAKVTVCGKTEHLNRVTAWSGTAWNTLTSEGLSDAYKNLPVEIDISDLELAEGYFRYYWIDADGNASDVLSLPFPAITEPTPFHLQAVTAPEPGYKILPIGQAEYYALDELDPYTFYFVAGLGIVFNGVQYSSAPTESAE
ncbi:hypothetical protein [uncultured Victivallis sp.]|uniref:hypothetical protein n=1 Tax=uncultured Victivallis sp. TaxID=354118 RepID=UPI002592F83F|nr:hypothetical protein [uncultured Victivallis sp.]